MVKIVPVPEVIVVAEVEEVATAVEEVATVVAEVNAVATEATEAAVLMTRPVADAEPMMAKIAAEVVVAPEVTAHPVLREKKARTVAVVAAPIPVVVMLKVAKAAEAVVALDVEDKKATSSMVVKPMAMDKQELPSELTVDRDLATKESLVKNGIPMTDNLALVAANAISESPKAPLVMKRKTRTLPKVRRLKRPREARAISPRSLSLSLRRK
jgi:hypothetical protein